MSCTREERHDYAEQLYRITEFHNWVRTNLLWPHIPDSIVNPLRDQLRAAEKILIGELYTSNQLDKLVALHKMKKVTS